MEFLAVVNNYPQMNLSPSLIRRAADAVNFHDEEFIRTWQEMALLNLSATKLQAEMTQILLQAQKDQMTGGPAGAPQGPAQDNSNPVAQRDAAQATPNTRDQIEQQITNQTVQ